MGAAPRNTNLRTVFFYFILATPLILTAAYSVIYQRSLETAYVDLAAVVKVYNEKGGHGTGFHIGNGVFVSAGHVFDPTGDQGYFTLDGSRYSLKLEHHSKKPDFAILTAAVGGGRLPALELGCRLPEIGEEISLVGFPYTYDKLLVQGSVAGGVPASAGRANTFVIAAPVGQGQSGGPVIDSRGKVIGLVQGIMTSSSGSFVGLTGTVSIQPVCNILNEK